MYKKIFGFTESPFNLAPDPHFFYHSDIHREALARLKYGLQEKVGFILVTGEIGSGKTTLINTLLEDLGKNTITACINNTRIAEVELIRNILREFDVETDIWNKSELIKVFNNFLIENHAKGNDIVLIIDESQNLTLPVLEEVRLLSNLETQKEKLLQIILVGQPELRSTINRPELKQLNQRISVKFHIEPLSKQETAAYIKHRLKVAGSKECNEFNKKAINRIYSFSKGIPRKINTIADNALLIAYVAEKKVVTDNIAQEAINEYKESVTEVKDKKVKFGDSDVVKRIENIEASVSQIRENLFSLEKEISFSVNSKEHKGKSSKKSLSNKNDLKTDDKIENSGNQPILENVNLDKKILNLLNSSKINNSEDIGKLGENYLIENVISLDKVKSEYSPEFTAKMINTLLNSALNKRISILSIYPEGKMYKVDMRMGIDKKDYISLPYSLGSSIVNKLKTFVDDNKSDLWNEKTIKIDYQGDIFHTNLSFLPVGSDLRCVLTFQYPLKAEEQDYKHFGFSEEFSKYFEKLLSRRNGIIIVTGPQNSGKTDFLYTTLSRINTTERLIISIERKILSRIKGAIQIELGEIPTEKLYELPSKMLFQHPDVIAIQYKMKDVILEEFINLSSRSLILLELNSDNLNDLIIKLQRFTTANEIYKNILAIIQLRKLRSLCPECKVPYEPKQQLMELVKKVTKISVKQLYHENGCSECNFTGYSDFCYLLKMTPNNGKISRYFSNNNLPETTLLDISQNEKNKLVKEAFFYLSEGITSFEEVKNLFL